MSEKHHLDSLILSYLRQMERFPEFTLDDDERYRQMADEVQRLLEVQRIEGVVPLTERRR